MHLYYREEGSVSLPPLMILHGLWGASENWLKVSASLSGQYHVIIPDLPNHGQSPHTGKNDYDTLASHIHEFILQLNLPQPLYILGHSMGGKILMNLLLEWPELISKAIVADIAPKDYRNNKGVELHQRLIDYIQSAQIGNTPERTTILRHIREHFPEEELYQLLAKNIRRNKETNTFEWKVGINAIQESQDMILSWHPTGERSSTCPVLFIKGENSDYIDKTEDLPVIRKIFPAASFCEISGADHAIHADHPRQLAACISNFLQNR